MEIVKDPDFSKYTVLEEADTGDGLRMTFYESEELGTLLNLDWDEDSKWAYLGGENIVEAFAEMVVDLIGREEAARVLAGKTIVPVEEMEAVVDAAETKAEEYEQLELELEVP